MKIRKALALGATIATVALAPAAQAQSPLERAEIVGRWSTIEPVSNFKSAAGKEWMRVDIAPCRGDYCGVAVGPTGKCGATLFRFKAPAANKVTQPIYVTGKWGSASARSEIMWIEGGEYLRGEVGSSFSVNWEKETIPYCRTR